MKVSISAASALELFVVSELIHVRMNRRMVSLRIH